MLKRKTSIIVVYIATEYVNKEEKHTFYAEPKKIHEISSKEVFAELAKNLQNYTGNI